MKPTCARAAASPRSSSPLMRVDPALGLSRPAKRRSKVVFPAPFGPKSARHSAAFSSSVTSLTARRPPNARVSPSASSTLITRSVLEEHALYDRPCRNIPMGCRHRPCGPCTCYPAREVALCALGSSPYPLAPFASVSDIDVLLQENRKFPPSDEFRREALLSDASIYDAAARDPEAYWAKEAEALHWVQRWSKVLDWHPPRAKWFIGGKINVSYNCIDRHIDSPRRNKAAIVWEGEPGDRRTLTYWDLYVEVQKFANVLKKLGVRRGDRVAIYMPLVPEAASAMLACTRIGAIHSVVFGGFSPESLRDRINEAKAKRLVP